MWIPVLMLTVLLAIGCAEAKYEKYGKSMREAEKDLWSCEDKILAEHQGLRNETAQQKQQFLDDCMKEKGYRPKQ